jgi:polyisoprenoid-binding protein YceI
MAKWELEPGHTAAEFCVRHMMVTWVRGHFKDIHGTVEFDPAHPTDASFQVRMDARNLWSGQPDRDAHLRSADFLDVENHPHITFQSRRVEQTGSHSYRVQGELTIRGVTRAVLLEVDYLGQWQTPFWVGNEDKGPVTRAGFLAKTVINRRDFGVSWNASLEGGGTVVGDEVRITIDAEAIRGEG